MKKPKFVASILALGLGIAWGNAHALIVDNFNSGSLEAPGLLAFGPGGSASGTQSGTMLGTSRAINLQMLSGSSFSVVTVPSSTGVLDINNGSTERSNVQVSWNFSATDFTDAGSSTGLFLALPSPIDKAMDFLISLSSGSNTSTYNRSFPGGSSGFDFFLPFTSFLGSASLTALTSLVINISSLATGADTQIDLVETRPTPPSVPEPGTALLLSAGLLGFWMRRKQQG